jgi:hypothetical protein
MSLADLGASGLRVLVTGVDGGLSAAIPGYVNQPHAEAVS